MGDNQKHQYKIDKGIPIPPLGGIDACKFPCDLLNVGESFFVPGRDANSMRGVLQGARQRTGNKFCSRSMIENGVEGVRVWRTE